MESEDAYTYMIYLLIFIIIEFTIAIANQFFVVHDPKIEDLTTTEKILYYLRLYFNIIETCLVLYGLFMYGKYYNMFTLLLLAAVLLAALRYFLFAYELIYYFIDDTKENNDIVFFIERRFGKVSNIAVYILLVYVAARIFFFKAV